MIENLGRESGSIVMPNTLEQFVFLNLQGVAMDMNWENSKVVKRLKQICNAEGMDSVKPGDLQGHPGGQESCQILIKRGEFAR